ncbi:MAG TPA: alginate lyase family protein [Candidatus Binatia bacterium]|nr:alginate lyase family protein [Candidatus Binatia bacterium]
MRSLFSPPAWGKKPEPRVRYGQTFLPGLSVLGRQHVADAKPVLERAEAVRGRRFTYLGRTVGFPGRIDWDPAGLSEAWRVALNALDEVIPLGVAGALAPSADVRRRWYDTGASITREWIGAATPGQGVAWGFSALARRIPNLLYLHAFFGAELRADPAHRRAMLESLYLQTEALAAAVPTHPPDDDMIHAGRALFMAGRFFDGMEARAWLESGASILWTQLREQVNEDGGHCARNPVVHALVLADYLEIFALLLAANDDVPLWARKRVKGMADFLARVLHPDGEVPLFHGAGVGIARPAGELLATAAIVLHEPEMAPPGDLPGVWPLLVVGDAGRRTHAHLARRGPGAESRALRKTGFYVLAGDPGDVMLVDGASPPPDGDDDVFGYELSVGGARLVVDSGIGSEGQGPWAEYFRSTRAHNVVSVRDADQRSNGRVPAVADVHWVVRDGLVYFAGTHDGFARLALDLRLTHRRRIFCLPGRFWLVCDELLGSGEWAVESFVHFHPEATVTGVAHGRQGFVASRSPDASVQVVPAGAQQVRMTGGVGEPRPQGWYAARPGERRPAPVLSLAATGRLPLVLGYALVPRAVGPLDLRFQHDAFRLDAILRAGGTEWTMTVVQGDVELASREL